MTSLNPGREARQVCLQTRHQHRHFPRTLLDEGIKYVMQVGPRT